MTGTALGIVLDVALMAMLGVAIYFGVRLNRQMAIIRSGRDELEKLIGDFAAATGRAEGALVDLKAEVGRGVETARESSRKAAELCDDLEFLIKRGEKLADGLSKSVSQRPLNQAAPEMASEPRQDAQTLTAAPEDRPAAMRAGTGGAKKAKAKSKSELLKALQDMR